VTNCQLVERVSIPDLAPLAQEHFVENKYMKTYMSDSGLGKLNEGEEDARGEK
jgi:hypothetical protein